MRVLLDNNINPRLRAHLDGHECVHCSELGWSDLKNGELLRHCEEAEFDALLTVDSNMRHQQRLEGRRIALVVIAGYRTTLPHILSVIDQLRETILEIEPGEVRVIDIPRPPLT